MDRLEVYPYQRLADETRKPRRSKKRRNLPVFVGQPALRYRTNTNAKAIASRILMFLRDKQAWIDTFSRENLVTWAVLFVLSRALVLEEILPFSFAFVAAFYRKEPRRNLGTILSSFLGLATGPGGYLLWSNFLTTVLLVIVVHYIPLPRGRRSIALPVVTASVILISKTLFFWLGQPSFYQEMIIIFEALIAGVLTFIFALAEEGIAENKAAWEFDFEEMASFSILAVGIILGLTDITFFKLSLTGILTRLGILVAALLWGSGGGTMAGVLAGAVPALSARFEPEILGIYAISGLVAGLFRTFTRLGVIVGFMLGSLLLSVFVMNTPQVLLGVWETGIASVVFLLLPESLREKVPVRTVAKRLVVAEKEEAALLDEYIQEMAKERVTRLGRIFEELSLALAESDLRRSSKAERNYLNILFDEISQGFCKSCALYATCWDQDFYRTYKNLFELFSLAESTGKVDSEDFPPSLRKRCLRCRDLAAKINQVFEHLRVAEYWEGKLLESKEIVSNQLRGVSDIIKNLAQEIDLRTRVDQDLRTRVLRESRKQGVKVRDAIPVVTPDNQVYFRIVATSCADGATCDTLAPTVSLLMGETYEVCDKQCPRQAGKGRCEFTLSRAYGCRVVTGAAQLAKERVSGDSFTVATLKEGKELLVLSDGMGVGKRAFMESRAVVNLLEELLTGGFAKEVALKTINSVLLLRSPSETFATVDLCMVDLYSAEADFVKIGSAPSFIKRGTKVGVVTSSSPPIGILNNLETVSERKALRAGDIIVMVTDGVLDSPRGRDDREARLSRLLAETDETDPQKISDLIINRALDQARGQPADDMTVLVARIDSLKNS